MLIEMQEQLNEAAETVAWCIKGTVVNCAVFKFVKYPDF
jgi:hypothetical protein